MSRSSRLFSLSALISILFAAKGCSNAEPDELRGDTRDLLQISRGGISKDKDITVCWNFPGWEREKAIVRSAFDETWGTVARVTASKWESCGDVGNYDIWIDMKDDESFPHSPVGPAGIWTHMKLNFLYNRYNPAVCGGSQAKIDRCIRLDAIHEFGHALGFKHERAFIDERFEACNGSTQSASDFSVGPYDPDSIMNYCHIRSGANPRLSPGDVAGVQRMYGTRGAPSDVGWWSLLPLPVDVGASDDLCYLTAIGGAYRGDDDGLVLRSQGTREVLDRPIGTLPSLAPYARARCTPRSLLGATGRSLPIRAVSEPLLPAVQSLAGAGSVCALTALRGALTGGIATAMVSQSAHTLTVAGGLTGGVEASARCFDALGSFHVFTLRTISKNGAGNGADPDAKRMLRTDEGVCFLSGVSGEFAGDDEVAVVEYEGWFYLNAHAGTSIGLAAKATCVRFFTPTPPPPLVHVAPANVTASVGDVVGTIKVRWTEVGMTVDEYELEDCTSGTCAPRDTMAYYARVVSAVFPLLENKLRICSRVGDERLCSPIVSGYPRTSVGRPPTCPRGWVRCDDLTCQPRASLCDFVAPTMPD